MTTLAMMATYEKKRLKCYGTVAAGEHVAVTVTDGAPWIGEGKALRLRVLFGPNIVAVFPFAEGDTWTVAGTQDADAACELNLNTVQAEKYLKRGGTCLWILDDVENHTLYATGEFDVLPWPKRRGIDEPIDLDGYPLLLDEINGLREEFEAYQQTVSQMLATKQDTIFDLATIRSGAAAGATAVQPAQIARFVDGAEYRQSYGERNNPAILFMHGTNVIVALDATPFVKDGMVSGVAVVGGNLVITFNTDSGKQPITVPLTDIFDPDNYYDKDAVDNLLDNKQDALTFDNAPTSGSNNPVKSGGIWSAIWGALAALPTGFTSLYDWCVSRLSNMRGKTDLAVYGLGNASVTFPEGYSITYNGVTYRPGGTGRISEKIQLYGPIESTAVPQYVFWVPAAYKDDTDFDPSRQYAWCMYADVGDAAPHDLMYGTGASFTVSDWDTTAPTLTLSNGEESGGHPTMARPLGATGDTLAKVSQMNAALAGKLDKSSSFLTLSLTDNGFRIADAAGVYYVEIAPNAISTNFPDGTDHAIAFPSATNGVLALIQHLAPDYDASASHVYKVDDLRAYDSKLYRCVTAHTATSWVAANWTLATVEDVLAALRTAMAGKADASAIPYSIGTPTVINTASSEVVEGETVNYGAATLANRTSNIVQVTAATALDELRITFPAATSGKVRDFGLRVEIGTGSVALAAPALVPIAPTGETIKIENADGTIPALADGTATAKGVTLLYFSETASGVFVVKGEQVEEVA